MESLQQLANESFSYSWLLNLKPSSLDLLDDASIYSLDEDSFIEINPTIESFRRALQSQDFEFPNSQPMTLVHADQLFSNGFLLPLQLLTSSYNIQKPSSPSFETLPTKKTHVLSESSSKISVFSRPGTTTQLRFLDKCQRSSRKILLKYLGFLRPLYQKVSRKRSSSVASQGMNGSESVLSSPRTSTGFSTSDWCRDNMLFDSDIESSIYEAVLHCKK
ncbi:putative membrane-associated kinase regulator 6 [Tasmannia lanceolata]|uniref:putative membrane-associated kinase regulator 6 n=1 Tax=Tasmannia lanceolata TaxID=3420 RepID=UPI00406469E1